MVLLILLLSYIMKFIIRIIFSQMSICFFFLRWINLSNIIMLPTNGELTTFMSAIDNYFKSIYCGAIFILILKMIR